jgi:hypothetical protein
MSPAADGFMGPPMIPDLRPSLSSWLAQRGPSAGIQAAVDVAGGDMAEREFLAGFERAAQLAQRLLACPPCYSSGPEYVRYVADLMNGADDVMGRGLAAGCLAAVGEA